MKSTRSASARIVIAVIFATLLAGCRTSEPDYSALQRYEFEEPQMGVPFRIVLYATNSALAEKAAHAAFARIAQLNEIMSDYETLSEISILSRSSEEGSPEVPLSRDLWIVLERAQKLAYETEGAFDVTVGPCVALWRKARREKEFPDAARLDRAHAKVGYRNLVLNQRNRSARLLQYGMRLDLGAIAKGYAADEALRTLRAHGIDRALVAASGDLALAAPPPGTKGWRVEVIGYDQPQGPPSHIALLANCAIATSGDLFQRVELNGVRYSHIVNPFSCVGMTNHALATVIAKDCMTADSLATAITILPPAKALVLANRHKVAARVVRVENAQPIVSANRRFARIVAAD